MTSNMKKVLYVLGILSDSDIDWLSAVGIKRSLKPAEIIIRKGELPDALYLVIDGSLNVFLDQVDETPIATSGAGEILGEISFVDSYPSTATVAADGVAEVLAVSRGDIRTKLKCDTGFASRFYHAMAIFLASRIRSQMSLLNRGGDAAQNPETISSDELSLEALESTALAGARFDLILQRLKA